ncbi:MAG: hypothetical protein ACU84Q_16090 [Gammaproteobacteria bacterium]
MNWDAIGVLAELVSALAVVVTLIFLIMEVRQSRIAAESASVDLLASGWNTINGHVLDDPDFAHVFIEGLADPETMTPEQRDRFIILFQSYINHFTTIKKCYDAGNLPEDLWEYHASGMSNMANSAGGKLACQSAAITPAIREVFLSYENHSDLDYLRLRVRSEQSPSNNSLEPDA